MTGDHPLGKVATDFGCRFRAPIAGAESLNGRLAPTPSPLGNAAQNGIGRQIGEHAGEFNRAGAVQFGLWLLFWGGCFVPFRELYEYVQSHDSIAAILRFASGAHTKSRMVTIEVVQPHESQMYFCLELLVDTIREKSQNNPPISRAIAQKKDLLRHDAQPMNPPSSRAKRGDP